MGLILLPVLLGAIFISGFSFIGIIRYIRKRKLNWIVVISGILLSILLYVAAFSSYLKEGSVYIFGFIFLVPLIVFFLPFALAIILKLLSFPYADEVLKTVFVSVVMSLVIAIVLYSCDLFNIFREMGIEVIDH